MRLQLFLLLNIGFSDRWSCLTVVSARVTLLPLKLFFSAPNCRFYWEIVLLGEAQQINQGLRRLNAAIGDEAGSLTSLAAPL